MHLVCLTCDLFCYALGVVSVAQGLSLLYIRTVPNKQMIRLPTPSFGSVCHGV